MSDETTELQHRHDVTTVWVREWIGHDGVRRGGEVEREIDGETVRGMWRTHCPRCGAVPGSSRFEAGCKRFEIPRSNYRKPAKRYPREQKDGTMYSRELEEYFGESERFGGLSSVFGHQLEIARTGVERRLQSDGTARLPGYMYDDHKRKRLRIVWLALSRIGWADQAVLRAYYDGLPFVEIAVAGAHKRYFAQREDLPRLKEPEGRKYTTKELAEKAGVTRQRMQQMLSDAGVGSVPPRAGLGQPAREVTERELNQLKDL